MRARIPTRHTTAPSYAADFREPPGIGSRILQPLLDLAEGSDYLIAGSVGSFASDDEEFQIPRFIFMGPKGGGDTIRIGLFGTLRGDEPEGAEGLVEFFRELERTPETAKGFHLYAYPLCNPRGLAAAPGTNAAGLDLIAEFWRGSRQPEAYYLEREMGVHGFQGVVTLHTVEDADRFLAKSRGSIFDTALALPALHAARGFAPVLDHRAGGGDDSIPAGFLSATDELRPVPFELNFGIPRRLRAISRVRGTVAALKSVLDSYRTFIAQRQDL